MREIPVAKQPGAKQPGTIGKEGATGGCRQRLTPRWAGALCRAGAAAIPLHISTRERGRTVDALHAAVVPIPHLRAKICQHVAETTAELARALALVLRAGRAASELLWEVVADALPVFLGECADLSLAHKISEQVEVFLGGEAEPWDKSVLLLCDLRSSSRLGALVRRGQPEPSEISLPGAYRGSPPLWAVSVSSDTRTKCYQ
jgi:hypothetical protein